MSRLIWYPRVSIRHARLAQGLTSAERRCIRLKCYLADAKAAGREIGTSLEEGGSGARAYADSLAVYLACALSRAEDFNNAICRWTAGNQKVMNLFGRQAIPMSWDFAEANVLGDAVGAWITCADYVAECVEKSFVLETLPGSVRQQSATSVELDEPTCISTDPPYYDNISYADLSDFFYVWLRRTLSGVLPSIFRTMAVPKTEELIASPYRFGGNAARAKDHFEDGFRQTFSRLRRTLPAEIPLTLYYAFKQDDDSSADESDETEAVDLTTGWETFLQAVVDNDFRVNGTWPVRASQAWRMVSMGTNALASYIVLVCRPRAADSPVATRKEFLAALKRELPEALRHLQRGSIAPVDLAQASIGPGMAVFTRYAKVIEADGSAMRVRQALSLINQILDEVLAEQEGEFDADSRWAIAWFDQFGMEEGPFGVAETLSKAKVTTVSALEQAGIVKTRGLKGKVRFLKREELPTDWNPIDDARLRHWEIVQHLIRALDTGGETAAADLLRKLGGDMGEVARDLAYRLYNICERKGWANEALAYNGLVIAWPEISKLAQQAPAPAAGEQAQFF